MPAFRETVPNDLYSWHPHEGEIRWVNGSVHYCMGVDRQPEERIIGMNLASACWDEMGASKNGGIVGLVMSRLRTGDPQRRFLAGFTTPHGHGWLEDWSAKNVHVIGATTYENTHLDDEYIARLEEEYPVGSKIWRQEMMGEFVSKTGKVYGDVFSRVEHCTSWEPGYESAYVLTVDPGFRASGWLTWHWNGNAGHWSVHREWTPEGETTEVSARRVKREMNRLPKKVYMDTPSKSSRLHENDLMALRDVFPGVPVRPLGGHERSSDWRHKAVLAGLSSGRLKVSEGLCPSYVGKDERGLVHALETLEWPKESTRDERQPEQDPRKHIVDALEFGAAVMTPPKLARTQDRAKHLRAVS
jgi:hypothetical protein